MAAQIWIFTINRGKLDEFVQAWRQGIYPLRCKYGFKTEGAWSVERENQFVWVLSCEGSDQDFLVKDAEYYESAERTAFDPDPLQYIARTERWFVESAMPEAAPS